MSAVGDDQHAANILLAEAAGRIASVAVVLYQDEIRSSNAGFWYTMAARLNSESPQTSSQPAQFNYNALRQLFY
jgi:hypothetical protein